MNKRELREALLEELGPRLPGFRARKKDATFWRATPQGRQWIEFSIVDRQPEQQFSMVFCLRIDAAEAVVNRFSGIAPGFEAGSATATGDLSFFFPGEGPQVYPVTARGEVARAVGALEPALRTRILPFLDAHQDLASADALLNGPQGAHPFDRTNEPYRAMHAVTVAFLAANPRRAEIASGYVEASRGWWEQDREKLLALLSHLRGGAGAG